MEEALMWERTWLVFRNRQRPWGQMKLERRIRALVGSSSPAKKFGYYPRNH